MLVVPTLENLQWRNFPYVTTALIVINCLVFFVLQTGDDRRFEEAADLYIDSGLLAVEAKVYQKYQQQHDETQTIPAPLSAERELLMGYWIEITMNADFQDYLLSNPPDTTENPYSDSWNDLRIQYERMIDRVVFYTYGYKTAQPSYLTAFTHMFLHADLQHLLGNMVFLFLVGVILESVMGSSLFLVAYLIAGLAGAWLELPFSHRVIPGIGASGAISGIMGTYSVVMGLTRIPVFYSFGFYFGNLRLPALILLFFWTGKELYYYFYSGPSSTNFLAHIAGFVAGGIIGLAFRLAKGDVGKDLFTDEVQEKQEKSAIAVEKGLDCLNDFQYSKARKYILQAIKHNGSQNPTLMQHLFNIDKQQADSDTFQQTAIDFLTILSEQRSGRKQVLDTYQEYKDISPEISLPPELMQRLILLFAATGEIDKSLNLLSRLINTHPDYEQIPDCLLMCGRACIKQSMDAKGKQCFDLLTEQFPDSAETRTAQQISIPNTL